jgi:hypothetical protein
MSTISQRPSSPILLRLKFDRTNILLFLGIKNTVTTHLAPFRASVSSPNPTDSSKATLVCSNQSPTASAVSRDFRIVMKVSISSGGDISSSINARRSYSRLQIHIHILFGTRCPAKSLGPVLDVIEVYKLLKGMRVMQLYLVSTKTSYYGYGG